MTISTISPAAGIVKQFSPPNNSKAIVEGVKWKLMQYP